MHAAATVCMSVCAYMGGTLWPSHDDAISVCVHNTWQRIDASVLLTPDVTG